MVRVHVNLSNNCTVSGTIVLEGPGELAVHHRVPKQQTRGGKKDSMKSRILAVVIATALLASVFGPSFGGQAHAAGAQPHVRGQLGAGGIDTSDDFGGAVG